jgi:Uma2 family endonuclease
MPATLAPPRTLLPSTPRLLTAADLAALPTHLPTGDVRYELHDGKLIVMAPPGDLHAVEQANIIQQLFQAQALGLGQVRGEVGVILRRNPDRVVGADAAFILNASLPVKRSPEGYLETLPEIIVEVRSKNDSWNELTDKAAEYLAAGSQIVWILDAADRSITILQPHATGTRLLESDTLTCELLPGFAVPVAQLFRGCSG